MCREYSLTNFGFGLYLNCLNFWSDILARYILSKASPIDEANIILIRRHYNAIDSAFEHLLDNEYVEAIKVKDDSEYKKFHKEVDVLRHNFVLGYISSEKKINLDQYENWLKERGLSKNLENLSIYVKKNEIGNDTEFEEWRQKALSENYGEISEKLKKEPRIKVETGIQLDNVSNILTTYKPMGVLERVRIYLQPIYRKLTAILDVIRGRLKANDSNISAAQSYDDIGYLRKIAESNDDSPVTINNSTSQLFQRFGGNESFVLSPPPSNEVELSIETTNNRDIAKEEKGDIESVCKTASSETSHQSPHIRFV